MKALSSSSLFMTFHSVYENVLSVLNLVMLEVIDTESFI